MTHELHAMLSSWLEHGTEPQKISARNRFALMVEAGEQIDSPLPPAALVTPTGHYPSLGVQAWNAGKALARVASAVVRGHKILVDEAEQARRLEICKACDHYDATGERCTICGCMARIKDRLATEICPIGRWGLSQSDRLVSPETQ